MAVIISESVVVITMSSGSSHWNDGTSAVPSSNAEQVRVYCSPAVLDPERVIATNIFTVGCKKHKKVLRQK